MRTTLLLVAVATWTAVCWAVTAGVLDIVGTCSGGIGPVRAACITGEQRASVVVFFAAVWAAPIALGWLAVALRRGASRGGSRARWDSNPRHED